MAGGHGRHCLAEPLPLVSSGTSKGCRQLAGGRQKLWELWPTTSCCRTPSSPWHSVVTRRPTAVTRWRRSRCRRSTNAVLLCQPHATSPCGTVAPVPNLTRWRPRTKRRLRMVVMTCAEHRVGSGIHRGFGAGPCPGWRSGWVPPPNASGEPCRNPESRLGARAGRRQASTPAHPAAPRVAPSPRSGGQRQSPAAVCCRGPSPSTPQAANGRDVGGPRLRRVRRLGRHGGRRTTRRVAPGVCGRHTAQTGQRPAAALPLPPPPAAPSSDRLRRPGRWPACLSPQPSPPAPAPVPPSPPASHARWCHDALARTLCRPDTGTDARGHHEDDHWPAGCLASASRDRHRRSGDTRAGRGRWHGDVGWAGAEGRVAAETVGGETWGADHTRDRGLVRQASKRFGLLAAFVA